jgi:hypothetical protein
MASRFARTYNVARKLAIARDFSVCVSQMNGRLYVAGEEPFLVG